MDAASIRFTKKIDTILKTSTNYVQLENGNLFSGRTRFELLYHSGIISIYHLSIRIAPLHIEITKLMKA